MATCKATRVETTYDLHLSEDEAMILLDVCGHIGGQPEGPRGKINAIASALQKANVPRKYFQKDSGLSSIYFADKQ